MQYQAGYKYRLCADEVFPDTGVLPDTDIDTQFIRLDVLGNLLVRAGYAWDGPSGPTLDTPDSMTASLAHDALYQLFREHRLDPAVWRDDADRLLRTLCLKNGMSHARAEVWYIGVRLGAADAARHGNKTITVP